MYNILESKSDVIDIFFHIIDTIKSLKKQKIITAKDKQLMMKEYQIIVDLYTYATSEDLELSKEAETQIINSMLDFITKINKLFKK